jgi:hypothetical protein
MHVDTSSVLDRIIYSYSSHDVLKTRDAVEGMLVLGANGVGKSKASGAAFATSFLQAGFGGLVLTAKGDEVDSWREYTAATGREKDLVIIEPGGRYRFNPLEYEFKRSGRGGQLALNIASLFLTAMSGGEAAVSNTDPYWNDTLQELLVHAIELAAASGQGVQLSSLLELIRSAPQQTADIASGPWQESSRCWSMLLSAAIAAEQWKSNEPERFEDFVETVDYWLQAFPGLAPKTRSIIVSSFTARSAGLLRRPLRRLLCTETSPEVTPDATHRGKIVVVNIPVKEYGGVGRFAQMLYKTVWQRATERRQLVGDWRPVFLWVDEAQLFAGPEDITYQQTARARVAATIYLSQNLPNFYAAFGKANPQALTESLLGCLQTKVFHANGCPTTNGWAEKLFAQTETDRGSFSFDIGRSSRGQASAGFQEAHEPGVPAIRFTTLRKATAEQAAEAIVFQTGRRWRASGANFLKARFPLVRQGLHDKPETHPVPTRNA